MKQASLNPGWPTCRKGTFGKFTPSSVQRIAYKLRMPKATISFIGLLGPPFRRFIGQREHGVGHPPLEPLVVHELLEQFRIVLEHRRHHGHQRLVVLASQKKSARSESVSMKPGTAKVPNPPSASYRRSSLSTPIPPRPPVLVRRAPRSFPRLVPATTL